MKILIAHNEYRLPGGEDAVVENETRLLAENGHEVIRHIVSNHSIRGLRGILRAAWNAPYSPQARRDLARTLARYRPDVVHVHNFSPLLTPAIYDACRDARVPVVQTLHDYRPLCANGLFLRDDKVCEDCTNGSAFQSVVHGCYRGSRAGSIPVARMVQKHRSEGTWSRKVDRFIAPTRFVRSKFIQAGFPAEKIAVKPHFIFDPVPDPASRARRFDQSRPTALFVGRLSAEKGIRTLLEAWRDLDLPLRIAGDGPLLQEVRKSGLAQVKVLGQLTREEVSREMLAADFLLLPSLFYETFGLVLIEAFAHGLPVAVTEHGCGAEIVEKGRTGIHFAPGSPVALARAVREMASMQRREMADRARATYEQRFGPGKNLEALLGEYAEVSRT